MFGFIYSVRMVERIQDLHLPHSNVSKIIKDALPDDVNMDKEARVAIARATSVFIMYLSSNAATNAHKHNHKTFSADDVFASIDEMDFRNFVSPMKGALTTFRQKLNEKKVKKQDDDKRKSNDVNTPASSTQQRAPLKISPDVIEIDDSD